MNLAILPVPQRVLWEKLAGVRVEPTPFYLAGGTAAALHLEHRESIDFDFFRAEPFRSQVVVDQLRKLGRVSIESQSEDTFVGFLSDVKVSYFAYPYPLLREPHPLAGINVASLEDIAAMKIIAVGQRGSKKDFIDIHELLHNGWNLESIFRAVDRKYRDCEYNRMHLLKSLTCFEDADSDPWPKMIHTVPWTQIKHNLETAVREFLAV